MVVLFLSRKKAENSIMKISIYDPSSTVPVILPILSARAGILVPVFKPRNAWGIYPAMMCAPECQIGFFATQ